LLLAAGAVNGATQPHYPAGSDLPLRIQLGVPPPGQVDPRPPVVPPPGQVDPRPPVAWAAPEDTRNPYQLVRPQQDSGPAGPLLCPPALTATPLATRRRYPLASFLLIAVCAFRIYRLDGDSTWTVVASVIAAYSAPMYSRYRNLALASVVVAALLVVGDNRD